MLLLLRRPQTSDPPRVPAIPVPKTSQIIVTLDECGNPIPPNYECGRPFWPNTATFGAFGNKGGVFATLSWTFVYNPGDFVSFQVESIRSYCTVTHVVMGSRESFYGIVPGDRILTANGESLSKLPNLHASIARMGATRLVRRI